MTTTETTNGQAVAADASRVLLFGLPGGGKSALLGAFARASEIQERTIGGRIHDVSQGLRQLRDHVYDQKEAAPQRNLSSFPIEMYPFVDGKPNESGRINAVIMECDSRNVAQLNGTATPVYNADAVLFVLDASSSDEQVEAECQQFREFLTRLRKGRGHRTDEPNLPLWLVLAKCDRLAKPGDNHAVWAERIEMRKEEAMQRFGDAMKQNTEPSFGTVDFAAAATGIRHPLLTNVLGREDEPFGVAELFRDAIVAAKVYRDKKSQGEMNIRRLVTAAGLVAAAVVAFVVLTPMLRNAWKPSAALNALAAYRHMEGAQPSGHLADPIEPKIEQLHAVTREPSFTRLSAGDQIFVNDRLNELEQYRDFAASLKRLTPPADARTLDELKQVEDKLKSEAGPPTQFVEKWAQSGAGKARERLLQQIESLRTSVNQVVGEFNTKRQEFDKLYVLPDGKPNWNEWGQRTGTALAAPIPVVDANIANFGDTESGQKRYDTARQRLAVFRGIAHSLGMVPGPGQTLIVNREFKVTQAPELLAMLLKEHPKAAAWGNPDVPDVALADVKVAARNTYNSLLNSGRTAIATAFGSPTDGPESPARWRTAMETVAGDPAMKAWNDLARITLRLAGDNTDPMAELTAFLKRDEFILDIQSIDVIQAGGAGRLMPTGSLILFVQSAKGQAIKKSFRGPDDPSGDRIRFKATDNKPINYRVGDLMWAELGVTDSSKADLQVTWWANGVRSKLYQFDRLSRSPKLHKIDQRAEDGQVVPGIRLEITPPGAVPQVPDLMPEVERNR